MARRALLLGILLVLTSGIAWAVHVSTERERLGVELGIATEANQSYLNAIEHMRLRQIELQRVAEAREQRNAAIGRELKRLQQELRYAATKPELTDAERACMAGVIPDAVLDVLRGPADGVQGKPPGEGVSTQRAVYAFGPTDLFGPDVDGFGGLLAGAESHDRRDGAGSTGGGGFLP